jgi:hypothetical protein
MTAWVGRAVGGLVTLAYLLGAGAAAAQDAGGGVAAARKAAEAWLAIVDQGGYPRSWDEASSLFRRAVEKDRWVSTVKQVRGPLGTVRVRALRGAQHTTSLPGAPPGDYVVIQYDTAFDGKRRAVETITPMLETDGTWRVSGYYVR